MTTIYSRDTISAEGVRVFPASFGQERLWFLDQLEPGSTAYVVPVVLERRGPLDLDALTRSLNALLTRHEVLRTTLGMLDGRPVQLIAPCLPVSLTRVDLGSLPATEREAAACQRAREEAQRPFDLAHGPLVRTTLVQLDFDRSLLLLSMHHVICDGWSIGLFCHELTSLYEAYASGQPSSLPSLPLQYADYAVWQREWLQGEALNKQLAYWQQQLAAAPTRLDLPTDHPPPAVLSTRGATRPFTLSHALSEALKVLSRQEGVTLYMTLLAAFGTLLMRYSGQEDLVLGTTSAGRRRAETEQMLGFFVNTLPLRLDLSGNPTFRQLLSRVREWVLEGQAHQDVPFEALVQALHPDRSLGQMPLVQVLLTLAPPPPKLPVGWTLLPLTVPTGSAKFELSLELEEHPKGLSGYFEYRTELFEAATIARMARHWQRLLEGIVCHPEQRLGELPLLTEAERQQILVEWNATATEYPSERCLHQLFEEQVERTPDAVAAVFEGAQLTYRELNSRANQLAHYLQRLGVGPEVLVAVCLERSLELVVALLGILKAGGAYVPLDPGYPQERLAFMLEDSQVKVLLTQERLRPGIPAHGAHVVYLDADAALLTQQNEANPSPTSAPEHLAYVIYTSGSTGRPKGVAIAHRSTVAFVCWALGVFTTQELAGVLASTSICFDLSVFELFVPLSCGGTAILVENLLQLPSLVSPRPVTLLNTVPSVLAELLRQGPLPASVRTVTLAGEPLPRSLVRQLQQQATIERVYNLYGPTEDTTYSTWALVEPGEEEPTIGRPIANSQAYILDKQGQPVPIGVPGELYLGGAGLARGYLNRPELTAERFIPHPFRAEPGARLYKTGDRARYRPDGTIAYLGRLDHQVKLRGFRIELGEIESVLRAHPAVQDAIVIVREDVPGDKRLVAYVVLAAGQAATIDELKSHLAKHVPSYMLPSAFVLLEALPLTPNGKLDRGGLPAPQPGGTARGASVEAPTRLVHYQLLQIWEELLAVRPIGIRDNFFDLGGHSLLAARLLHRIAQVCGTKLPLSTLFAGPTIAQLAKALLGEATQTDTRTPLLAVQAGGSKRPFFYLHGDWRGGAFYCFALARALGVDQPFYVLEPYKFEGLAVPPSFEQMAAAHLQALRAVQPEGPYLLGGFCTGGLVAYEMARQLRAQGQGVDVLVLIDADYPAPAWRRGVRAAIGGLAGLLRRGEADQLDWFLWLRHLYRYLRFARYRGGQDVDRLAALEEGSGGSTQRGTQASRRVLLPQPEQLRQDWTGIYDWVALGYTPSLYGGQITFLTVGEEPWRFKGWRKVAATKKEVEVHTIPGTHISSRTEHLPALAERLRACLMGGQTK